MSPTFASQLVISATAYIGKAFLKFGTKDVQVNGLPYLLQALTPSVKGKERQRGVVTVCNHNSVVDDPFAWGTILPLTNYFPLASPTHTSRHTRWTLGARDIMFTNPAFTKFFELGQVINTERGGGVFQPAIDQAVKLLQRGEWIHIFPEGKVNQQSTNPEGGLLRFKWGVGRIIMDSEVMPEIIPMWISGFDQIMPEPRDFPRFVPRTGAKISVNFGPSISSRIQPLVNDWRTVAAAGTLGVGGEWERGQRDIRGRGEVPGEERVRIQITDALQQGLAELGCRVEDAEGRTGWRQSRRRS